MKLKYDKTKWEEQDPVFKNTLQFFITNKCDRRCKACFYGNYLNRDDMDFSYYQDMIYQYLDQNIKKIILIGGEPTLHPDICKMIDFNQYQGLETTVYTNGLNINVFKGMDLTNVSLRVGVLGLYDSEKPLADVDTDLPITVVYMLRNDNINWLMPTAMVSEFDYNCNGFMISSIRDLIETGSFWCDTESTISNNLFALYIQKFVLDYNGNIPYLHLCRRTVIDGPSHWNKCRYLNIYPDKTKTICPFDISFEIKDGEGYELSTRPCQKHSECILQKVVLKRRIYNV